MGGGLASPSVLHRGGEDQLLVEVVAVLEAEPDDAELPESFEAELLDPDDEDDEDEGEDELESGLRESVA